MRRNELSASTCGRCWRNTAPRRLACTANSRLLGADKAADRLAELPEWQSATIVKAVPDTAQQPVRARALNEGKLVYMAVPKLAEQSPSTCSIQTPCPSLPPRPPTGEPQPRSVRPSTWTASGRLTSSCAEASP